MENPEAFFIPNGPQFVATDATRGPWDPALQHGGPPIALAAGVVEAAYPRAGMQVARVTAEILRPIPIGLLEVTTSIIRAGKSVELLAASVVTGGQEVLRLAVERIRTTAPMALGLETPTDPVSAGPEKTHPPVFFPTGMDVGYHSAMEFRFRHGNFTEQGPAAGWGRMRIPLIAGSTITPLARALILADSGNGISGVLDYRKWIFINPDLTVYLHRLPEGEWVCLDAKTTVEPHGIGLAESVLSDLRGPFGRGQQSLFVAPRG
jgi:hypothetical protein